MGFSTSFSKHALGCRWRLGAPDRRIQSIGVSQGDATPGLPHHGFPAGDVEPRLHDFSWVAPCERFGLSTLEYSYSCIPGLLSRCVYLQCVQTPWYTSVDQCTKSNIIVTISYYSFLLSWLLLISVAILIYYGRKITPNVNGWLGLFWWWYILFCQIISSPH